jgi:hypothetical protein
MPEAVYLRMPKALQQQLPVPVKRRCRRARWPSRLHLSHDATNNKHHLGILGVDAERHLWFCLCFNSQSPCAMFVVVLDGKKKYTSTQNQHK